MPPLPNCKSPRFDCNPLTTRLLNTPFPFDIPSNLLMYDVLIPGYNTHYTYYIKMPPVTKPQDFPPPPGSPPDYGGYWGRAPPPQTPPPPPGVNDPFNNLGNVFSFIFGILFFISETLALSESSFNSITDMLTHIFKGSGNRSENNANVTLEIHPTITITQSSDHKK